MASIIAENITSPLGFTTEETYKAILSSKSALQLHQSCDVIPFKHNSALFSAQQTIDLTIEGLTRFESLAIKSIAASLANVNIPLDKRTILVLCSTKGNVELLGRESINHDEISLGASAQRICSYLGIIQTPIVVCNACISGVSGLVLGNRLVDSGMYEYVIVCGVDVQNPFVISGFQSLKALSDENCRPFDIERNGLNLGEAAATIILGHDSSLWQICRCAINNDAHHITNPSPSAEGCVFAIQRVLDGVDVDSLAMINAHGTATMFNDQMESKAISRSGLLPIPMNALKGYFGHTMGAAGVIETIVTMKALEEGIVIGTKGFKELGVSGCVNMSSEHRRTNKTDFLKIISGFGGGNGAMLLTQRQRKAESVVRTAKANVMHRVKLTPISAEIDGTEIIVDDKSQRNITNLYKRYVTDYPKFYKMDPLARLGLVATEMLLSVEKHQALPNDRRGIVFFNKYGSAHADHEFLKTISFADNFYPSPSLFVYTLPNIVNGEIALRNHYHGETAFYVLPQKDDKLMKEVIDATFEGSCLDTLIAGWLEYIDDDNFEADLCIINNR